MSYLTFFSKLFNSRIFYMFGIFFVFMGIALENVMRTANTHINASRAEIFFLIVPVSVLLFLISAFLIVMKRRWADFPAIALLFLGFILHRPTAGFEYIYEQRGILQRISDLPSNYFFYLACVLLIAFLVVQIRKNKYRISLM